MPQFTQESASKAGRRAAANMTPAQRRERARKAHLAAAVNAVVDRAPELTPDQAARLRAVFAPAIQKAA